MLRGRDGGGAMVLGSRRLLTLCASGGEVWGRLAARGRGGRAGCVEQPIVPE